MGREANTYTALDCARFTVGYALASAWATVLLFSALFSAAGEATVVTLSMLPGAVACASVLLLRDRVPAFDGRSGPAAVYAVGMAAGTLLATYPSFADVAVLRGAGLVVSGFFTILLLLTWFEAFAQLAPRTVLYLAGGALLVSAAACFGMLACPAQVASVVMTVLPLVSFALLPAPVRGREEPPAELGPIVREALSWRTLVGVAVSFFVIGAIGTLAPYAGASFELASAYLLVPVAIAMVFAALARFAPARLDASVLFKLLLVATVAVVFLMTYAGGTSISLVFFAYITADVLLWTVLLFAARKTPVAPWAVFCVGWLAECVGNVCGQNVAAAMGASTPLLVLVVMLIVFGVGFAFGDGLFVFDLEPAPALAGAAPDDAARAEADGAPARAASPATAPGERIAAFAAAYGLSARETDVFALWVTGHGQKRIQDDLFISESTVKTHLRSIYRKCDVHNRDELLALFEAE